MHHLDTIHEFIDLSATPILFIDGPAFVPIDTFESENGILLRWRTDDGRSLSSKANYIVSEKYHVSLEDYIPFIKMEEVDLDDYGKQVNKLYPLF